MSKDKWVLSKDRRVLHFMVLTFLYVPKTHLFEGAVHAFLWWFIIGGCVSFS